MATGHVPPLAMATGSAVSASSVAMSPSASSTLSSEGAVAAESSTSAASLASPVKDKAALPCMTAEPSRTDALAHETFNGHMSPTTTVSTAAEAGPSSTSASPSAISVPVATTSTGMSANGAGAGPSSGPHPSVPLSPTAHANVHTHSRSSSTSTAAGHMSIGSPVAGPSSAAAAMPTPATTPAKRAGGATDRAAKRRSPPCMSPDPATPATPVTAGVAGTFGFSSFGPAYPAPYPSASASASGSGSTAIAGPSSSNGPAPHTPTTPNGPRPYLDGSAVTTDSSQTYGYSLAWQSAWDYRAAPRRRASASMATTAHAHVSNLPRLPSLRMGDAFGTSDDTTYRNQSASPTTLMPPHSITASASSSSQPQRSFPYGDTAHLASPSASAHSPIHGNGAVGDLSVLGYRFPSGADNAASDPRRAQRASRLPDRADEWALLSEFGPVSRTELFSVRGGVGAGAGTVAGPSTQAPVPGHAARPDAAAHVPADPELRAIDNTLARVEEQLQAYYAHLAQRNSTAAAGTSRATAAPAQPPADVEAGFTQRWASVAAMRESIRRVRDGREQPATQRGIERFAAMAQERQAALRAATIAAGQAAATNNAPGPVRDTAWLESPTIEGTPQGSDNLQVLRERLEREVAHGAARMSDAARTAAHGDDPRTESSTRAAHRAPHTVPATHAHAGAADDVHSFEGPRAYPSTIRAPQDDRSPEQAAFHAHTNAQGLRPFMLSPSPLLRLQQDRASRRSVDPAGAESDWVRTVPVDTRDNVGPATHDPEGNPRRDIDIEYLRASAAAAGARAAADIVHASTRSQIAAAHGEAHSTAHEEAVAAARRRWEQPAPAMGSRRPQPAADQTQAGGPSLAQVQAEFESARAELAANNSEAAATRQRWRRPPATAEAFAQQHPWLELYAPGPHPDQPGASSRLTVNGPPSNQRPRGRPAHRFPVDGGDPIGGTSTAATVSAAGAPSAAGSRPADGADMASLLSNHRAERRARLVAEVTGLRQSILDSAHNGGPPDLEQARRFMIAAQALSRSDNEAVANARAGGSGGNVRAPNTETAEAHLSDMFNSLSHPGDFVTTDQGHLSSILRTARPSCPKSLSAAMSAADRAKVMRGIMRAVRAMARPTRRRAAQSTLKKSRWDEAQLDTDRDDACAICQDEYPPEARVSVTPCGHMFHTTCVDTWFNTPSSSTCPMCRRDLAAMALATRISLDGPDTARRAWLEAPADLAVASTVFF